MLPAKNLVFLFSKFCFLWNFFGCGVSSQKVAIQQTMVCCHNNCGPGRTVSPLVGFRAKAPGTQDILVLFLHY